jgi:hypothetical protein
MITMKELSLNDYDYDYRFDLQDGTTLGYVKHNRFLGCEFYYGSTQALPTLITIRCCMATHLAVLKMH